MSNPKVSIIIPIYNTAERLSGCLDSVLNQTHRNLEIILVDDGSTDDSPAIIQTYTQKDSRIKVITQKNQGQSAARNRGLKQATGDFISFLDSDDAIKSNFIQKLLAPYTKNPQTILTVCGITRKFLKTGQTERLYLSPSRPPQKSDTKKSYILRLLTTDGRLYSSVNKLYRADIAQKLKFDESLNFAEDTKFVLDYLQHADGQISFILEPLYIYNFGTKTSTINQSAINWSNWLISYRNLKTWLGPKPTLKESCCLKLILLRWRISYYRSKLRAKKSN
ncbi:MAG: glycosyltransferase [Candidatus Saccharibacteria bacterium]|nr:glycosyltransferase [Candidatus Saccharibacteria bacterium]